MSCGLADAEEWGLFLQNNKDPTLYNYDFLTFFKCMILFNSLSKPTTTKTYQPTISDTPKLLATYDDDARDYFQMATEICYLGKIKYPIPFLGHNTIMNNN